MSSLRGLAGTLVLLAGCGSMRGSEAPASGVSDPAGEIVAMLSASAEAWNRGDLEAFLSDYLDAPGTTFAGGAAVIRGLDEIRRRYQANYWRTGKPEGRLRFDEIEVRPLGPRHALAVGRYILSDPASGRTTSTGFFSLVLTRTERGWKIIHDHSSS